MKILLSNFASGATAPKEKPTLELTDILLYLLYGVLIIAAIIVFYIIVYKLTLSILNKKSASSKSKICNNCNNKVPSPYGFCPHCASNSFRIENEEDEFNIFSSTKEEKTSRLIAFLCLLMLIIAVISAFVINHRNSFDATIHYKHYSSSYQIYNDRIEVNITAKVDIENFSFEVVCTCSKYKLHEYGNYVKNINLNAGESYSIIIYMDDIIEHNSWFKENKIDSVKIVSYSGKVKNKDAIKIHS